jgi:hypothetical protein
MSASEPSASLEGLAEGGAGIVLIQMSDQRGDHESGLRPVSLDDQAAQVDHRGPLVLLVEVQGR